MPQARDIGIDVAPPARECDDVNCPFHGTLPVRGAQLVGQITGLKMQRSATIRREYMRYAQKYERFEKRTSRYTVHAPSCLNVKVGDVVRIMECRPISKMKKFVIVESRAGEVRIAGEDATVRAEGTAPAKGTAARRTVTEQEGE